MGLLNRKFRLSLILLCLLAVTAAGCQSIAGLDLNTAILQSMKAQTQESRSTVALAVAFEPEAFEGLDKRERQQLELLRDLRLRIDSAKVESGSRSSASGALLVGGKEIGFSLQQDETSAMLRIDGLKRPISLALDEASLLELGSGASLTDIVGGSEATPEQTGALARDLVDRAGAYWIHNLPNASRLNVQPVAQSVYGGGSALWQVDAGWKGMELFDWAHAYVKALLSDSEGLAAMLDGLFEVLQDHPEAGAANEDGEPLSDADKPAFVEEGREALAEMLQEASDSMQEARDAGELEEMFTDGSSLNVKLLLDAGLDIRSLDAALTWAPGAAASEDIPVSSVSLRIQTELWNVNGAVAADKPQADAVSWSPERWSGTAGASRFLRDFDRGSDAYKLLKQELQLGRQSAQFYAYGYDSYISVPSGQTLVPLRSLADSIGASLTYDSGRSKWALQDEARGQTIWLAKGSKTVYSGAAKTQLSFPPTVVDGTLYVPARDIAKLLGATASMTKASYSNIVEIVREVG